ncbi:Putative E3 ubiquitin ligase [Sarcoptes scabiei]|uniref:RING-type E3 ubiquitin transferase n=1 Tax=Sarcoptes scabiei TaxID=52283 RepID=A0A834QYU5_SARSC|nr:Putative E3 ubiquitin ligase [Sarcoptes scabiei]
MGNFWSNSMAQESQENQSTNHYFYPPKNGRFFGSTFIMGNDKFNMTQPESYLFGDNCDLNYLGGKPNPFPYTAPFPNEPMQMLKSYINIRKETLRLINPESDASDQNYTIEFVLDSDVDCAITVYFLSKEEITTQGINYFPKENSYQSTAYHFKAGIGQLFSKSSSIFNPQNYNLCDLLYNVLDDRGEFNHSALYPVVIQCLAEEGEQPRQSHSLLAIIEKVYDNIYSLKAIKQKIFIDGLTYLLQEIYGIENKVEKLEKNEDENDKSFECVICMSDLRDTLILPCRHLCLCNNCADSLRYHASNCPICRVPFRALLQIKAVKCVSDNSKTQLILAEDSLNDVAIEIAPEYEAISLIEALNGLNPKPSISVEKLLLENIENSKNKTIQNKTKSKESDKKKTVPEKNNSETYDRDVDDNDEDVNNLADRAKKLSNPQKDCLNGDKNGIGDDSTSASSSISSSNQENSPERIRLLSTASPPKLQPKNGGF